MKIGTKILIATCALGVLAVGGLLLYNIVPQILPSSLSKEDKVKTILKDSGGHGSYDFLITLHDDYIDSWYKSVKSKKSSFESGGKTFSSETGKQIA